MEAVEVKDWTVGIGAVTAEPAAPVRIPSTPLTPVSSNAAP